MRTFASGRRRIVASATTTTAIVPSVLPSTATSLAGTKARWSCASGIDDPAHGIGERHRDGDADREPRVDEAEGRGEAPADEQERADAEQRRP